MNLDPERLIEIIREVPDARPYSYSGRGMHGRRCVAVNDVELADLVEACDDTEEAADLIREMRQDSVGLGHVYYWPGSKWSEDFDEDEDKAEDEGEVS